MYSKKSRSFDLSPFRRGEGKGTGDNTLCYTIFVWIMLAVTLFVWQLVLDSLNQLPASYFAMHHVLFVV